ncbi:MAG TPA: hypothetical protein VFU22_19120 [Roseiflexaceae bacterium]|nr:hypothetical protein [Roseiflexaceae bacterium]
MSDPAVLDGALAALTSVRGLVDRLGDLASIVEDLPISARWDKFDLKFEDGVRIDVAHLQVRKRGETTPFLDADLQFALVNGKLQGTPALRLYEPVQIALPGASGDDLYLDDHCLAFRYTDQGVNRWLRRAAADLLDEGTPAATLLSAQLIFGGPQRELRLDWELPSQRTIALPGVKIQTPASGRFSLILTSRPGGSFDRLALVLSLPASATVTASSTFAWGRDGDRELQNQPDAPPAEPLFSLSLTSPAVPTSLVLLDMNLDQTGPGAPKFLRQLTHVLPPLEPANPMGRAIPAPLDDVGRLTGWSGKFKLSDEFKLPFLNDPSTDQFVRIDKPNSPDGFDFIPATATVSVPLGITVNIGPLTFNTEVTIDFNAETFALKVRHTDGLKLLSKTEEVHSDEYLGLSWSLKGVKQDGADRFHHLTLVTENYDYQLKQAPGATFTVSYAGISEEPIRFTISDLVINAKGISLKATVGEEPVRLKGINTKFTFRDSGFEMIENEIREFTLGGGGPLPPDLVGEAHADIWLRFIHQGGRLRLWEGHAELKGTKLLHCKASRFRFQVDRIGLSFVEEGQFHLYFTLTGSAEFVLADGDDKNGALAWLPAIKINMVDCPLTGDMSVIARHVDFLITLPKPISFSFLGCFEFEIRAFGFLPQADFFNGDAAMSITGQMRLAQGDGDNANSKRDFHKLYVGLPERGSFIPRIHFEQIGVSLAVGELFKLEGFVKFDDSPTRKGFSGEGMLQLPGMPTIRAAFSFLRVRRDADSPWVRAWFIYLEVGRLSIGVQILPIFIREIGLGFGYRYTIASISATDQAGDIRQLVKKLDELAHSQADLARLDAWQVDLEGPGESLRWTIVLRAMFSATTASAGIVYNQPAEEELACLYLFDAMIAFRSDFTFYISARGWINTNYNDFATDKNGVRSRNLVSGYILLVPRQKRFLARVVSNPNGTFGSRPALPKIVEDALKSSHFAAALLIEPGLIHYELGWPNQLSWGAKIGPLDARYTGGFIFRVDFREETVVIGISYAARATLHVEGGVSFKVVGVTVRVHADVAYGARLIGVFSMNNPLAGSAIYGAIGLEIHIEVEIEFWIKLLFFKKSGRISLGIALTAGLELALNGVSPSGIGARGTGTISLRVLGRSIRFSVHLGFNEGNVDAVLARTQKYLQLGLEGGEVAGVPGVGGPPTPAARLAERVLSLEERVSATPILRAAQVRTFEAPHYTIFVIQGAEGEWGHFVLLPKGEPEADAGPEGGRPEDGFLPAPPDALDTLEADFAMRIAGLGDAASYELEQFIGGGEAAASAAGDWVARGEQEFSWRANWDAIVIEAAGTAQTEESAGSNTRLSLSQFLRYAFLVEGESDKPTGDPQLFAEEANTLADERVYNPSDAAFEAAVRGAYEQFRGSPFFKFDETQLYDRTLKQAFQNTTTVYHPSGTLTDDDGNPDPDKRAAAEAAQQADQIRGQIVQDIIADMREYAADPARFDTSMSLAFQMGLVFRFRANDGEGGAAPDWLDGGAESYPAIRQRLGPDASAPADDGPTRLARPFNISRTSFANFPPLFRRVQQYASASTIAIAWDLAWDHLAPDECPGAQREPEHHLIHYQVRRRSLDTAERDRAFTVKPAEVLHREIADAPLTRLAPRFQVIDQFGGETDAEQAALPPTGRSYLYTITPIDVADNPGRPLTLVATRYPTAPPRVPVDARLIASYALRAADLAPAAAALDPARDARPIAPAGIEAEWSEPAAEPGPGIETYQLIFRRDSTLPAGSYGLDAASQGDRSKLLPTSNARTLPTDVIVELSAAGPLNARHATIDPELLRAASVLPRDAAGSWRPEGWQVFMQTVSTSGVPSALAPVELVLRVDALDAAGNPTFTKDGARRREERQPIALEWMTRPTRFEPLPPHDTRAQVEHAHFPMPAPGAVFALDREHSPLDSVAHRLHPALLRCIRFRWNQGPSDDERYPLELHAGYHLLELDADAHTQATMDDPELLAGALRTLQEIQMVPAEDLALIPADTLASSRWEAWYASAIRRQRPPDATRDAAFGTRIGPKPWYSWRDSLLEWPEWPGMTDSTGLRTDALHPQLQLLLDVLEGRYTGDADGDPPDPRFLVDPQAVPLTSATTLDALLAATPPQGDPYGWAVLQQFGLSTTFALRDDLTRAPVAGQSLIEALQDALALLRDGVATSTRSVAETQALYQQCERHLHVELLFQAGRSIELKDGAPAQDSALLAIVQVSLRPAVRQIFRYAGLDIRGAADARVELRVALAEGAPCSLINLSDPAAGEVELPIAEAEAGLPVVFTARLNHKGETRVLVRAEQLPEEVTVALPGTTGDVSTLSLALTAQLDLINPTKEILIKPSLWQEPAEVQSALLAELATFLATPDLAKLQLVPLAPFAPTGDDSIEFGQAPELEKRFADSEDPDYGASWRRLKRYVDTLFQLGSGSVARLPDETKAIAEVLPDMLAWTQRFFDHNGDVQAPEGEELAQTGPGPWLATAYPRAGTPAYAAPDASGRLKYDQLVEDKWAHIYRYYLRPYGRYDRLLQNLRSSPNLFADLAERALVRYEALPEVAKGGLDVVLEREERIAQPMVLRSGRLDELGRPDLPAPPGRTWEVLVAQHPEQALSERNQTVARQLGFRQVAFTLLRRLHPDYRAWVTTLREHYQFDPAIVALVQEQYPQAPLLLPPAPDALDHLDFTSIPAGDAAIEERAAALRSIDLPLRVGNFGQRVLALQWEALPFFYEHRLLLIAQAASVVSQVNSVTQRDFEYQSPTPAASMAGARRDGEPDGAAERRGRRVRIPLKRFWDALPLSAKQRWAGEDPDVDRSPERRKLSELPDPEVVYQLVEFFSGNIEVQAELLFDKQQQDYVRRQLGQRFIAGDPSVLIPADQAHGDYVLETMVYQRTEDPLLNVYPVDQVGQPTQAKLRFRDRVLVVDDVLTREDLIAIFRAWFPNGKPLADDPPLKGDRPPPPPIERDQRSIRDLYRSWFSAEPVSREFALGGLDARLRQLLDFVPSRECVLAWRGPLSEIDRLALEALPGDDEFRAAIGRLTRAAIAAGSDMTVFSSAPVGLDQVPAELPPSVTIDLGDPALGTPVRVVLADGGEVRAARAGEVFDTLAWTGPMYDAQFDVVGVALAPWSRMAVFAAAVPLLLDAARAFDSQVISRPLPIARPRQDELPPSLRDQLRVDRTSVAWQGGPPTDAQRAEAEALAGDPAFPDGVRRLMALYDTPVAVRIGLKQDDPTPPLNLPPVLDGHVAIDGEATGRRLTWRGPKPADPQWAALRDQAIGDGLIPNAFRGIIAALEQPREVELPDAPPRPRQNELEERIRGQLLIEPAQVTWTGRLPSVQARDALVRLRDGDIDPPFRAAIGQFIEELSQLSASVPLGLPARPLDVPIGQLTDRLLIGRTLMRYHGLMAIEEGQALRALALAQGTGADGPAIDRLYALSLGRGMRGRELRVRARRGSAAPSPMVPITAETLEGGDR